MAPVFGTKKVVLFGGYAGGDNNETWVYDLNNNSWTNMTPAIHPHGMRGHVMASIYGQDRVILYSGYYFPGIYPNETWMYDLSDNNWTLQSPDLNPGSMRKHTMASVWGQDKVILYTIHIYIFLFLKFLICVYRRSSACRGGRWHDGRFKILS